MYQHPTVRRRLCEAYIAELLSRNHCWGSKTIWEGSSGPRCTKTGQKSCGIKSFGLMNQSLKFLVQIRGSMCSKAFMTELLALVSHQPQSMSGIDTRWGSNWIKPYCCIPWSYLEHGLCVCFVLKQDNDSKPTSKLCQRYIKSKEEQSVL